MNAVAPTQPTAEVLTSAPVEAPVPQDTKPAVVKSGGRSKSAALMLIVFGIVMVIISCGATYYFFFGAGQSMLANILPK